MKVMKKSWGSWLYINIIEKHWEQLIYICIFCFFQALLCVAASWNECMDHYMGLWLWQVFLGIGGIWIVSAKKGNVKLVLYAVMLLSIGQLVQAIIQKDAVYESYMNSYYKFMTIAIIGGIALYFVYRKFFVLLYTWQMQLIIGVVIILCFILLKSPLGQVERDGAILSIRLLGFELQIIEFFKPLMVMLLAGLLCRKKKLPLPVLLLSLFCTGAVSGLCVMLLNEFGTGIVVALTGVLMYFVFQNTRESLVVTILCGGGIVAMVGVYLWGSSLCSSIPMEVSSKIFAEEFSACCNKSDLAELLEDSIANLSKEDIQAKEAKLTEAYNALVDEANKEGVDDRKVTSVTYSDICYFLRNVITKDWVDHSYPSEEGLNREQRKLVRYIQVLAGDDKEDTSFRRIYRDEFIKKKIYTNRMLSAYRRHEETQSGGGFAQKIEEMFLEEYLPIAEKVQRKFSGLLDPEGEKQGNAYQVNNAMSAMSTSGWFGNGPDITKNDGDRIYSYFADMVFTMVVSELGYIMGVVVIILNLLIFQEMVFVGLRVPDLYQKGICVGMGFCWIVQAFFIIGGNCRVFPLAGITLPLIAQGGTSLIVSLWIVVLIILISMYPISAKRVFAHRRRKNRFSQTKTVEKKKSTIKDTARKTLQIPGINDDEDDDIESQDDLEEESEEDVDVSVESSETIKVPSEKTKFFTQKSDGTIKNQKEKDDWKNPFRDM